MLTDYKFWYIKRDDAGFIIEAGVRFYEGEVTTELEKDPSTSEENKMVTRYRRASKVDTNVYFPDNFGQIKTDEELNKFVSEELVKDGSRTPIPEQL